MGRISYVNVGSPGPFDTSASVSFLITLIPGVSNISLSLIFLLLLDSALRHLCYFGFSEAVTIAGYSWWNHHHQMMANSNHNGQPERRPVHPPRGSSRFAPGLYFNFEWGVSLNASNERPTHIRGVSYTSHRMQERFQRDEEGQHQQHRAIQNNDQQQQNHTFAQSPPIPDNFSNLDVNWQTRDYQQERQRRQGVRSLEQHSRGSSAPPSFDRDEAVSPLSPEPPFRPVPQTASFPRETLDRPLPYSPAHFRLGEEGLPWSVQPWYRPSESETSSPPLTRATPVSQRSPRRNSASHASVASKSSGGLSRLSLMGGLPSLGYESTGRRERERERERRSPRRRDAGVSRAEDAHRVHDLGAFHSAMMGVEGLGEDQDDDTQGLLAEPWRASEPVSSSRDLYPGTRSLGWAVRTEPDFGYAGDFMGFYGSDVGSLRGASPPPAYHGGGQWDEMGRRMARPRSSADGMAMGLQYY